MVVCRCHFFGAGGECLGTHRGDFLKQAKADVMARIRTIKPEFWTDEDMAEVSEAACLLAIGLLNYADDEGYFNANPKLIKAAIFPIREPSVTIPVMLRELSNHGYLSLFSTSDNRDFGLIKNFAKHQVVNKPRASKIKEMELLPYNYGSDTGGLPLGMDQGSGKGKDQNTLSHGEKNAKRPDGDSQQSEQDGSQSEGGKVRHEYTPDFEAAWLEYPRRPGSPDKHGAFKAWNARLRDGVTAETMMEGVRRYAAFVVATGKSGTEFIKQAKTFFGPSRHFEDEWLVTSGGSYVEFRYNQNDPRPYSEQYLEWEQRQHPAGLGGMAPVGSDAQNLRPALECEEWQSSIGPVGAADWRDER
ncbi:hypothetical protein YERSI8AC_180092 [Enterobacterales bacterium 8AC]|nr:hypothetical protein YERSI8AC_180092 [Enterobacterales bacterium 8AC]